jgi:uncharacterized protein YodC (DUF2158 family)
VTNSAGQKLAFVYFEDEPGRRSAAKLLTKDEARRIAANITKLPAFLKGERWRMTFKEGDHVQLKTGGAEMIVTTIEKMGELTVVYCVWIDEDHQVQRAPFPADVLEPAKSK